MRITLFLLLMVFLFAASAIAQDDSIRVTTEEAMETAPEKKDSIGISLRQDYIDAQVADDSAQVEITGASIEAIDETDEQSLPTKSTLGAVLRSAVIPGWGQFYNESYLKVPVVVGLTGFLVWGIVTEHGRYIDYASLYDATIDEETPGGDLRLKRFREFYRDRRDTYGWWLLVTYLLQIADAYVDAALFSFDVSEDAALILLPAPSGLGMQLRF
ncbi:MAG: hypothetical protein KFH87_01770 [Bacteroidetes bacterium]|nr:hypothetical protein [Bacteroidota bacterium]